QGDRGRAVVRLERAQIEEGLVERSHGRRRGARGDVVPGVEVVARVEAGARARLEGEEDRRELGRVRGQEARDRRREDVARAPGGGTGSSRTATTASAAIRPRSSVTWAFTSSGVEGGGVPPSPSLAQAASESASDGTRMRSRFRRDMESSRAGARP